MPADLGRRLTCEEKEAAMVLVELMVAAAGLGFVLLMIPFLLLMVGIVGAVLLALMAPAILIALVLGWFLFPGLHSAAVVLLLCVAGLLLLSPRARHRASGRPL
jgi:hypothetical protein